MHLFSTKTTLIIKLILCDNLRLRSFRGDLSWTINNDHGTALWNTSVINIELKDHFLRCFTCNFLSSIILQLEFTNLVPSSISSIIGLLYFCSSKSNYLVIDISSSFSYISYLFSDLDKSGVYDLKPLAWLPDSLRKKFLHLQTELTYLNHLKNR